MSRTPNLRKVLGILVMGCAGSSGCIHNHYYGAVPGCAPGQTVTTQVGPVCDVPNGNVVVAGASSPGTVSSNVTPQSSASGMSSDRVVISTPSYGSPSIGQNSSRISLKKWMRPDPEAPPILKAEGAYDESTYK